MVELTLDADIGSNHVKPPIDGSHGDAVASIIAILASRDRCRNSKYPNISKVL